MKLINVKCESSEYENVNNVKMLINVKCEYEIANNVTMLTM